MIKSLSEAELSFYQEFLMKRGDFKPEDFGVEIDKDSFLDRMVELFSEYTRGSISLDEMLLRPDLAKTFCNDVREKTGYYDVPDDILLRSIIMRRKNPV